jgi:hypothetical protein
LAALGPSRPPSLFVSHAIASIIGRSRVQQREKIQSKREDIANIVLVHGGFVDGSGWEPLYQILRKSGHDVSVVQNPTSSLAEDVAVTKRALDQQVQRFSSGTPTGAQSLRRPATIRR